MTTLTRFALHLAAVLPSLCVACSGRSDITIGNARHDAGVQPGSDGTAGAGGSDGRPPVGGAAGLGGNPGPEDAGTIDSSETVAVDSSVDLGDAGNSDEEASGPAYPPGNPTGKSSASGFFTDGFVKVGPWSGYVFTYADTVGSTITPTCGSPGCTRTREGEPCAKGVVAPQEDGTASYVGMGFHLNEPKNGGRGGPWSVNGGGLLVNVTNPPPGARILLQEPNAQDNNQRYCALVPEGGAGTIPWNEFKTWCWGDADHPSVTLRQGTQLDQAAIVIPGVPDEATPFEFCLINIAPQ